MSDSTSRETTFAYGFRVDPMTWISESDSVQAAQVRALLLNQPKDGDEAILAEEIDRLLSDQHDDGSLGDENTTGKLIRLSRLGCSPDRPEVKAAVEFVCSDEERGGDGLLGVYGLYVAEWAGYHDTELIGRSTRQLARQAMTMDFWSLCPWGGQVHTRGMWSGRAHADIGPALDRGINLMLNAIQDGKGWPNFHDAFGYLDAAGVIDHPLSRQIVLKQIPLILRTQQADGTWGGEKHLGYGPDSATYIVLRALIRHGLLEALREAPPLPPDWEIVRSVPTPAGDLAMLTAGGGRLWFYDKASGEAVGISPEDGAELTRVKLPSDVRNIAWQDGRLAVIRVKEFVKDDWDIEELVLVDVDGDGTARGASMNEWPGSEWHVYDFEGGPPVLEKGGPDADWGEAPFGKHTAGVTTDGDDLWVLDSETNRLCLIVKTDSGRLLTAPPAADATRLKMTVARPNAACDIPRLDGAAFGDDWADRGFRVDVFSQLNRGSPQFRADSIYSYRAIRTALAMAWNADGLLLHLTVGDDQAVEADTDEALWENNGDCILLYVAPQRGLKAIRRVVISPGMSEDHPNVRVLCNDSLTPPKRGEDEAFHRVDAADNSAVRVVRTKTDGGYALDILVPWKDLEIEPAAGDEIGVQVILLDRDSADPDAPMAGAYWYPGLGARKNTFETHRIRLSERASPAVTAVIESGPGGGAYDIAVTAGDDLAGKTVTVVNGDQTIAEAVLMTDELSGYAIGSIPLPLPAPGSPLTQPRVMLAGQCIGRLHPERPVPDKETPMALLRDGDSAMLTGMEAMDWGGDFFGRQDSFIAVFREVVRAAGHDVSFAEVMGLSGAAFDLYVQRQWCPSAFVTEGEAFEQAQKVFGYELEQIELSEGKNTEGVARLRQAVVERINAGLPVIYMDGEFSLIVGYRDGGDSYICKPYAGGPPAYTEMEFPATALGPAWYALAPQKAPEPMDRREAIVESLRMAIAFAEMPAPDEGGDAYGFVAYEWWIDGLRNPPEDVNLHANAYGYAILLTSRQAAGDYLRLIADEVDAEVAGHLRLAADRYAGVAKRMYDGRKCIEHPWDESWTPENRAIEADIMAANLADERVAIDTIKAALTAIVAMSPTRD